MPIPNTFHTLSRFRSQRGLTLLELLLVVTILSAVAWMTLGAVSNNADQVRFEDTRNRLRAIRRAIIGDASQTLNGHPAISGYVADMGNLPADLNALIAREYCSGHPEETNSFDCATAGGTWVTTQPAWAYNATYNLWAGWNGPYLTAAELAGYPRFQDGWGNNDGSNNFGWVFTYDLPANGDLTVRSLGVDGAVGGAGVYEVDYPPAGADSLVAGNDYRVLITDSNTISQDDEIGGLFVDFGTPASCWRCSDGSSTTRAVCEAVPATWYADGTVTDSSACTSAPINGQWQPTENICMKIAVRTGGAIDELVSSGGNGYQGMTWDGTYKTQLFSFEDTTGPQYDEDTYLPMGQMVYRIFEYDDATTTCTANEYPKGSNWKHFSILPRQVIQPLEWEVR